VSIADAVFASAVLSALGRLIVPLWLTMLLSPCLGKSAGAGKCRTECKKSDEFFHALFSPMMKTVDVNFAVYRDGKGLLRKMHRDEDSIV
jgi:hypothetical protein